MTLPWLSLERWQTHLVNMIETNRQDWPRTNTARFSEMDWYTLLTEAISPLHNFHPMYYQDHHRSSAEDPLTVNQTYAMLAVCAAMATRWLQEDLGPRLRAVDLEIPPEMHLQPDEDVQIWAQYRNQPMPPQPDDFSEFPHWAAIKMARVLPAPNAAQETWHAEMTYAFGSIHETLHRLSLIRMYTRRGDGPDASSMSQLIYNLYQTVVWLVTSLQEWALNLDRYHKAVPEEPPSNERYFLTSKGVQTLIDQMAAEDDA